MRVLFSNPPWWQERETGVRAGSRWPHLTRTPSQPDRFVFGGYLPYPFFMGFAATYVAARTGAETVFRDSLALAESYESYFAYLDRNRFDYVFIESATPSWDHDSRLIARLHQRYPDMRIVVTGPITVAAQTLLDQHPVHAAIRGEYEKGAVAVLNGAEGMIDFDLLTREEMNDAPIPYLDETYAHRYWDDNPRGQRAPQLQVWSSRGCPYKCIFCVWPATMTGNDPDGTGKRSVRHYSAEYMEAYLTEMVGRHGYKTVYFDDDTFNLGDAHVERMCAVMRRIGLPWSAMCRADTIRTETWALMRDAGCFGVKLGFESGNQYVVDKIVNKRLDLERAKGVVHECKRLGMTVHGTFTIGLPGETPEQMDDTRRFIRSLPFDTHQLSGCAEIEGTPLASLAERGSLERYEGARVTDDYIRQSDGARKLSAMVAAPARPQGPPRSSPIPAQGGLVYCDPGWRTAVGPETEECRALAAAAVRRGIGMRIFAGAALNVPPLHNPVAVPLFRHAQSDRLSQDPLSGGLENFFLANNAILQDLRKIAAIAPADTVFWPRAGAADLMAVVQWMQSAFATATCPRIVLAFGDRPGLSLRPDGEGRATRTLTSQAPQFLRFAIHHLRADLRDRLMLATYDPSFRDAYGEILERPFVLLPRTRQPESGREAGESGLAPRLALVVGSEGGGLPVAETTLALSLAYPAIRFVAAPESRDGDWPAETDLLILTGMPDGDDPRPWAALSTALDREVPVVLPQESPFADSLRQIGADGILVSAFSIPALLAAVGESMAGFEAHRRAARVAGRLWRDRHGPDAVLEAVLGGG